MNGHSATGQPMNLNGFASPPKGAGSLLHLDEARQAVQADDHAKWDTFARREQISLKDGRLAFPLDRDGEHWEHLAPTAWATGQLCARLGIPASYFRRCPAILQDVQANYWLRNGQGYGEDSDEEQWLLRARGGTLRAVLSDRYSPLDNTTLLQCLMPMLKGHFRVDWFGLTDESLHLRVIDPQRAHEVLPDDELSVGVHIANSEVGLRSVTVDALVYRLVCTNGLIRLVKGKSLLRQRHIHLSQPRFVQALEEAIAGALGASEEFIEQLRGTTAQPVPDVEGTLEQIGQRWNLSESTRQRVQSALLQEAPHQQETVYGLVNALTNAAHHLPNDDRYDLEVLAGHLAEQGVSAYAPLRKNQPKPQLSPEPATPEPLLADSETISAGEEPEAQSVVDLACSMFEAEVVGRNPQPIPG